MIKTLAELLSPGEKAPDARWHLRTITSEECLGYALMNDQTREGIWVDPHQETGEEVSEILKGWPDCRWLAVIDTHTHADHISAAAALAEKVGAPLIMHESAPSRRVKLRVSALTSWSTQAGKIDFIPTPGHTPDGMCVKWGPFLFTGDTVIYGDVGREDLPGGDPGAHYESVQALKAIVEPQTLVLPGHDSKGGRASSWKSQLAMNSSLTQGREDFIRENGSFVGKAPKLLKEALAANFK